MSDQIITQEQKLALDSAQQILADKKTNDRVLELFLECMPDNTRRAHEGDIEYWYAWLNATGASLSAPRTEMEIKNFILQHVEGLDEEVDNKATHCIAIEISYSPQAT